MASQTKDVVPGVDAVASGRTATPAGALGELPGPLSPVDLAVDVMGATLLEGDLGDAGPMLAHEINNLLMPLAMQTSRVRRSWGGDERSVPYFEMVEAVTAQLSQIAEVLLAGSSATAHEPVRLDEVYARLDRVVEMPARIRLRVSTTESDILVPGAVVLEVLLNLVNNASEAMHGSGVGEEILVEASLVRSSSTWNMPVVAIRVHDDGPGFDASTSECARRSADRSRTPGRGIGLSVVRRLLRNAGGGFSLTTSAGRGATATIVLPIINR